MASTGREDQAAQQRSTQFHRSRLFHPSLPCWRVHFFFLLFAGAGGGDAGRAGAGAAFGLAPPITAAAGRAAATGGAPGPRAG
jgi:hypothetical protein